MTVRKLKLLSDDVITVRGTAPDFTTSVCCVPVKLFFYKTAERRAFLAI